MNAPVSGALKVLIVHHNTADLTLRLLQSLPMATPRGRPVQVHVLDNASTPEQLELLRSGIEAIVNVTLLESQTNLGFGEGQNRLFAHHDVADSDLLWVLNPDIEILGDCIGELESELDRGQFTVVSPFIVTGRREAPRVWYLGGSIDIETLRIRHDHYGEPAESHAECGSPFATQFVTGAAPMMFARSLRDVGGFPNGYFLYWEDVLLSWRLQSAGMTIAVVPTARLWHAVGASSGRGHTPTFYYWSARNRAKFASDIGLHKRQLVVGKAATETARHIARAFMEPVQRWRKVRAALRGTRDGLTSKIRSPDRPVRRNMGAIPQSPRSAQVPPRLARRTRR